MKIKKLRKWLAPIVILFTLTLFITGAIVDNIKPDNQCLLPHKSTSTPPQVLHSAKDYFLMGDYEYEKGSCQEAMRNYDRAIELNNKFAEAYNNRAYTHMRMGLYELAVPDLDRAIALRPNYINALMNRGDIYNFYYHRDKQRAIADYDRAIASGATQKETSVCGHRELAMHGWRIGIFLMIFKNPNAAKCD